MSAAASVRRLDATRFDRSSGLAKVALARLGGRAICWGDRHQTRQGVPGSEMAETAEAQPNRRDILYVATGAAAAVATVGTVWQLIAQMSPDASTLALSSVEVDISGIAEGQIVTVKWRGRPVFVRPSHEAGDRGGAKYAALGPSRSPARLRARKKARMAHRRRRLHASRLHTYRLRGRIWRMALPHGSVFDTSGRIRAGPAPTNLEVPKHSFIGATRVKIG